MPFNSRQCNQIWPFASLMYVFGFFEDSFLGRPLIPMIVCSDALLWASPFSPRSLTSWDSTSIGTKPAQDGSLMTCMSPGWRGCIPAALAWTSLSSDYNAFGWEWLCIARLNWLLVGDNLQWNCWCRPCHFSPQPQICYVSPPVASNCHPLILIESASGRILSQPSAPSDYIAFPFSACVLVFSI